MGNAPYYADVADGPESAEAYWLTTFDGLRIRVGVWPSVVSNSGAAKGTVFMLPGRTECIEKYGRSAKDFAAEGYASLAIDWRGQGIADRLLDDPSIGHVTEFEDYQLDLKAVILLAEKRELPKPWFLVGHSMGGAIGLQALLGDHPFSAASFSAPMWGIGLKPYEKALVAVLTPLISAVGKLAMKAPGTKRETYMLWQPFAGNKLTADADMYAYMRDQIVAHPDLGLGGPSVRWLNVSMDTCASFETAKLPDLPTLCFLGDDEKIVNTKAVRDLTDRWPSCTRIDVPKGRHEIMMEVPQTRADFCAKSVALFQSTTA